MTIQEQLMNLSEDERDFLERYMKLPPDLQKLYQLMICGSPEQQDAAELEIYDRMDQLGHDTTELRRQMAERINNQAKANEAKI